MASHPEKRLDDDTGAEVLRRLDAIGNVFAEELERDARLQSGIPEGGESSDIDFIEMSGFHRAAPAGEENAPADTDTSKPLSFYEEGIDDVDDRLAPYEPGAEGYEDEAMAADVLAPAPVTGLKDIIAGLTRGRTVRHPVYAQPSLADDPDADEVPEDTDEPDASSDNASAPAAPAIAAEGDAGAANDPGSAVDLQHLLSQVRNEILEGIKDDIASLSHARSEQSSDAPAEAQASVVEADALFGDSPPIQESLDGSRAADTEASGAMAEVSIAFDAGTFHPDTEPDEDIAPAEAAEAHEEAAAETLDTDDRPDPLHVIGETADDHTWVEPDAIESTDAPTRDAPPDEGLTAETVPDIEAANEDEYANATDYMYAPAQDVTGEEPTPGSTADAAGYEEPHTDSLIDAPAWDRDDTPSESIVSIADDDARGVDEDDISVAPEAYPVDEATDVEEYLPNVVLERRDDSSLESSVYVDTFAASDDASRNAADDATGPAPWRTTAAVPELAEAERLIQELQERPRPSEGPADEGPIDLDALEDEGPKAPDALEHEAEEDEADHSVYAQAESKASGRGSRRRRGRRRTIRWGLAVGVLVLAGLAGWLVFRELQSSLASPESLLREAQRFESQEQFRRASNTYLDFSRRYPDDPRAARALYQSAYLLYVIPPNVGDGHYRDALALIDQYLGQYPDSELTPRAEVLRGILHVRLHNHAEAISILQRTDLRRLDYAAALPALRFLSQAHAAMGDFGAARSELQKAAAMQGNFATDQDYADIAALYATEAQAAVSKPEKDRLIAEAARYYGLAMRAPGIERVRRNELERQLNALQELTDNAPSARQSPAVTQRLGAGVSRPASPTGLQIPISGTSFPAVGGGVEIDAPDDSAGEEAEQEQHGAAHTMEVPALDEPQDEDEPF